MEPLTVAQVIDALNRVKNKDQPLLILPDLDDDAQIVTNVDMASGLLLIPGSMATSYELERREDGR